VGRLFQLQRSYASTRKALPTLQGDRTGATTHSTAFSKIILRCSGDMPGSLSAIMMRTPFPLTRKNLSGIGHIETGAGREWLNASFSLRREAYNWLSLASTA